MAADETKQFLYAWLNKQGITPEYSFRPSGTKQRMRFICELSATGFPYRGVGNSANKKDAQTNAAKDFIQYLIRSGKINHSDVPSNVLNLPQLLDAITTPIPNDIPKATVESFSKPVFKEGFGPNQIGEGYRPARHDFTVENAKNLADAEDVDVNAALHGNWTIENAKGRLHQFLQMNKISADYKYLPIGPPHARSFQAEMQFYVRVLGRNIVARETASTQKSSSKSCALSIVRQLYHLRVIEPFSGTLRRPKPSDGVKPFPISIDPSLISSAKELLDELELPIMPTKISEEPKQNEGQNPEEGGPTGIPLMQSQKKDLSFIDKISSNVDIVSWSPPLPNWNPWTGSNIDEGHMATTSLDQLSEEFLTSFRESQQTSSEIQELMQVRSQLPVFNIKGQIMESISEYPIILVKGDTGCGKTTQICQFILDDFILCGQGAYCNVVVTQPRRISAISVAERIAHERGEDLGISVGYSVRFESCLPRPYASILFCTVGVLLRKLEGGLRGVSHVIVDEIHERDVNTDFLLVVLRDMLSAYPDLRVILMSATIDDTLFTQYFNTCPVIRVDGRAFPVETYFLEDIIETLQFNPSPDSIRTARKKKAEEKELGVDGANDNLNILKDKGAYSEGTEKTLALLGERETVNYELVCALLTYIKSMQIPGAVLFFLPGWNNIFGVMKYLQDHPVFGSNKYVIIPLHSQIPREDQHKVFDHVPPDVTKIILSTNIAETSLTIDDVVFVIDSCKVKSKMFTSHNNMTTYVQMWASRSSLVQRRGRAGRVRPGYCFHLCTQARFEALDEMMTPEMFRTPLHEIALTIKLLRLGGISQFLSKAPEPPPLDAVIEAQALLCELNCLDTNGDLTSLGKILAKLPLDPRLGKMLILGVIFGCADPMAIISANASNMSEVFNLGLEGRGLAPQQRSFGSHRHSDHYAMLNAYQQWNSVKNRQGENAEYEFCQQRLLSLPSLKMTENAKNQLLQVLNQVGIPEDFLSPLNLNFRTDNSTLDTIAALLCAGLYPNICYHAEKRKVLTTESKVALVHKSSINCSRFEVSFPSPFFIYGEKIRTRAISCKQMTMITPLHMLLFGCRKVELVDGLVRLDGWIDIEMSPEDAAIVVALRPGIEKMILEATEDPEGFFPPSPTNQKLIDLIVSLSRLSIIKNNDGEFQNFSTAPSTSRYESYSYEQSEKSGLVSRDFGNADYYGGGNNIIKIEGQEGDGNDAEGDNYEDGGPDSKRARFDGNFAGGNTDDPVSRRLVDFSMKTSSTPPRPSRGFGPPERRGSFGFSPRGARGGFGGGGPRGSSYGGGRGGGGFRFSRGNMNNSGPSGGGSFGNNGRPRKFLNTNRGGWSARGNNNGGGFRGGSSRGFSQPPRGNYPY